MSVFGIDFGNANCVVAVARKGGIDVVLNESSNRQTPAFVGFSQTTGNRLLGEPALDGYMGNFANTVNNIKRLIGRKYSDPIVQAELSYCPFKVIAGENGDVAVEVRCGGEITVFTITQILAMYLSKLRRIVEKEVGTTVKDAVISCPAFFTDVERRALVDAAKIAEINVLRLMNENTAAALVYGLPKADLPEEKPLNVVILDVGQAHLQTSLVAFTKGKLVMLACEHDAGFGGRDFDELLCKHFNKEFAEKFKVDVYNGESSKARTRALLRLRTACEKTKKTLSANAQALINVECIMDEKDVNGKILRDEFEALAAPLIERLQASLKRLMAASDLTMDQITSVELVGSATRMPCVIQVAQDFFGQEPKRTLDSAECIGKGCAFQAAMLSPQFRVRSFNINDVSPYPISLSWQPTKEDETADTKPQSAAVIFTKNNMVPCVKMLTFMRTEAFDLTAEYAPESNLAADKLPIGKFRICDIPKTRDGGPAKVKVKIGLNLHGVIYVESAQMVEEYEVEEMVPVKEEKPAPPKAEQKPPAATDDQKPMDTDDKSAEPSAPDDAAKMETDAPVENGTAPAENAVPEPAAPAEPKMEKKIKKKTTRVDCRIEPQVTQMAKHALDLALEKECQLAVTDRVIAETAEAKNSVETYVYDFRDRVSTSLAEFTPPEQKELILKQLQETEDWLYDDGEGGGEDAEKSMYTKRLQDLKALGDPIEKREREDSGRPSALTALQTTLTGFKADATSPDEKFAHIEQSEKDKVIAEIAAVEQWLAEKSAAQEKLPKHVDPALLTSDVIKKATDLTNFCKPIMSKPKPVPKPEEPKPEEPKPEEPKAEDASSEKKSEEPAKDEAKPMDLEID